MIDVCFLLEGTYPYVAGGVSTWVHQLISSMKDIRFGIVYVAPFSDPTRSLKYRVPENVIYFKEIFLHDYDLTPKAARQPRAKDFEVLKNFYEGMVEGRGDHFSELIQLFKGKKNCFDTPTFFSSKGVWSLLVEFYKRYADSVSFLDYFWTWRGTHLPLLQIMEAEIPQAKIYHAVSTGYAGLLGVVAKHEFSKKFFLTEHGIYTHERMLEISQANWIYERESKHYRAEKELSFFKKWWIGLFQVLSRLAYADADRIFTLFEGNKIREVLEGASAQKITVIPNGIAVSEHEAIVREKREMPQVGLVGRVVGIKDIKTFIQAAKIVFDQLPHAHFYVIGPTEEEEEYFEECKRLAESLKLEEYLTFTGRVDMKNYYSFLDLVVLTSQSEAQPYAILEANLVGIPVVATDVGACREMIDGRELSDRTLGPSGLVVEVANPEATAAAILKLLKDKKFYDQCAEAGKRRVKKYYDLDDLLSRYLNIYEQNL